MNEVRAMFSAYAAWPGVELSFQHYDRELSFLPGRCAPPSGRFLLARADVRPPAAPVCAGFPEHGANRNGSMCARRSETRLLPAREHSGKRKRAVFPGAFPSLRTERFAFEHICRPDPVFRLAGFTLPPEQPQVNCGDTGEGELRDAPGRQREARYGQGERRGISPCPAPWSTS